MRVLGRHCLDYGTDWRNEEVIDPGYPDLQIFRQPVSTQ